MLALVDRKLSKAERARIEAHAKSAVINVVDSPEQLIDRAALSFTEQRRSSRCRPERCSDAFGQGDASLNGKKVLVVDDDMQRVRADLNT